MPAAHRCPPRLLLASAALALSCASQSQEPSDPSEVKVVLDPLERPLSTQEKKAALKAAEAPDSEPEPQSFALLGARHDLSLRASGEANCRCLSARLYSDAAHTDLSWDTQAPRLIPGEQWVVALSSEGVECRRAPSKSLGASYQGYALEGDHVVVFVESLRPGRPLTRGAIIPRLSERTKVFIESRGSVYGRPLRGRGQRCRLTLPSDGSTGERAQASAR